MNAKIALGFGNNVDYEIAWNSEVIEQLIRHYHIRAEELCLHREINSVRDLLISILSFMQAARGGERFVASSSIIEEFARHFTYKITLGGTSIRAAIAMRKLGYLSALHLVTTNEHVRSLIPQDSQYVCSNDEDTLYPHLIVQFEKDVCVQAGNINLSTNRSNRLIYHNDSDNIRMQLNERFAHFMQDAKVLLVSGFNAMQDEVLLRKRLETVRRMMQKLPKDAIVFYEDAAYYEPRFSRLLYSALAGNLHIASLNEDELQSYVAQSVDFLDVDQVKAALVTFQAMSSVPVVVVHSMYWALAYGADAAKYARALKSGVTMATARYCYGDAFTVENYREIENLPPNAQGAEFAVALERSLGGQVCCVPVAQVDPPTATTVGLGDAFVGGFLPALLS